MSKNTIPIMVSINNVCNQPDPTTHLCKVDYVYNIGKYPVTIYEFTVFLNAIAKNDTHQLYTPQLSLDLTIAGIKQSGESPNYTYSVLSSPTYDGKIAYTGNYPISYINWFVAARYVNWLSNGQPTGQQDETTTENGAYDLSSGVKVAKNVINPNTGSPPLYYIPFENEWYKACFYSQSLNNNKGGYYKFATQSNEIPSNISTDLNAANYIDKNGKLSVSQDPSFLTTYSYISNIGSYLYSKSYYGLFDGNGTVWEIVDNPNVNNFTILRGGAWTSFYAYLYSYFSIESVPDIRNSNVGLRIVSIYQPPEKINIEFVDVNDIDNPIDPLTGLGSVSYPYKMGKYHITISQYTQFLNAIAKKDTYNIYNENMMTNRAIAGIDRNGIDGEYVYSYINNNGNCANRPITYVSLLNSLRFANWMDNGQPSGFQNSTTTENGTYNLKSNTYYIKNEINPNTQVKPIFAIPTVNELYKSAYYNQTLNDGAGGYYLFATQSNERPGNYLHGDTINSANYIFNTLYCISQSYTADFSVNNLTDVGAFINSPSYYGTFDQNGNVYSNCIDETTSSVFYNNMRGGMWGSGEFPLRATVFQTSTSDYAASNHGFRLVSFE